MKVVSQLSIIGESRPRLCNCHCEAVAPVQKTSQTKKYPQTKPMESIDGCRLKWCSLQTRISPNTMGMTEGIIMAAIMTANMVKVLVKSTEDHVWWALGGIHVPAIGIMAMVSC